MGTAGASLWAFWGREWAKGKKSRNQPFHMAFRLQRLMPGRGEGRARAARTPCCRVVRRRGMCKGRVCKRSPSRSCTRADWVQGLRYERLLILRKLGSENASNLSKPSCRSRDEDDLPIRSVGQMGHQANERAAFAAAHPRILASSCIPGCLSTPCGTPRWMPVSSLKGLGGRLQAG
ncbi:hypothetical protein BS50DRAFT_180812 [Corynespora cassiicola Philippines]|uniref:Uncharacterized protein n=1 Tax=Corynespora cassiicola Philippines TaxID=1448308 RepID=A0A2T2P6G8_CORCC|nr:hypothetical protein BS50DRAFT_180812 [Corynespora cassiicola Philippines]